MCVCARACASVGSRKEIQPAALRHLCASVIVSLCVSVCVRARACVCWQVRHQSELSCDCRPDCPLRPCGASRPWCVKFMCVCAHVGRRDRPRKCVSNAHVYTSALIYNCRAKLMPRLRRLYDYDYHWRPHLKTTNHRCMGRPIWQTLLIGVQGEPCSRPVRMSEVHVCVLIREMGGGGLFNTRLAWPIL